MRTVEAAAQDTEAQPSSRRRCAAVTLPPDDDDIALIKAYWSLIRRNPYWLEGLFNIDTRRLTNADLVAVIQKLK